MYKPDAFFRVGLKMIGLLVVVWSLTEAAAVVFAFTAVYNQPDLMPNNDLSYYRLSFIVQAVCPVLLFGLGFYFLKDGETLTQFAFRNASALGESGTDVLFTLFMKLAGLALIIYSIPKAFQIIANLLFVSSAKVVDTTMQTAFISQNVVATVIQLLLGLYLLRSGKLFYNIGFGKRADSPEE